MSINRSAQPPVIAFDSSLARSAYAVRTRRYSWEARSFIKPDDKEFPDQRFEVWRGWAENAIDSHKPRVVIYEKPTTLGQGSGAPQVMLEMTLRSLCAVRRIPVVAIYPSHLKKHTTGSGSADKDAMMSAVSKRVPSYCPEGDDGGDIADALAMLLWYEDGAPESESSLKKKTRKAKAKGIKLKRT